MVALDGESLTRAHHTVELGETPRHLIRKRCRCRYSSLEKFEDAFDTALDLAQTADGYGIFCRFSNFDKYLPFDGPPTRSY